MLDQIATRKQDHIALCANQDVEGSTKETGFASFRFMPRSLPELDWSDVQTARPFLGRTFASPILITGMTGGIAQGASINRRLAAIASHANIPMGVGSQRIGLDSPEHAKIFAVKDAAPDVFLIGNLGAAQLRGKDAYDLCARAVEMIDADALAIHVNVLQELIQDEGDRNFKGLTESILNIADRISVPVIVKEVGVGLDPQSVARLASGKVAALDVGGRGGTSWSHIEGLRSSQKDTQHLGVLFRDFGLTTAEALLAARKIAKILPMIATGGIRDGLTMAKALALGATMVGVGLPFMRAALVSENELHRVYEEMLRGLKITMLATGSRCLDDLARSLISNPASEVEQSRG